MVRPYLLKINNTYRTTSTESLFAILGITPINIILQTNYDKFQYMYIKNSSIVDTEVAYEDIDGKIKMKLADPNIRLIKLKNTPIETPYSIYTDGSKINNKVGFAICVLEGDNIVEIQRFKLRDKNSVYQAELLAIEAAVRWGYLNNKKTNIYTDSRASLDTLRYGSCRTELVKKIKEYLTTKTDDFSVQWIKAHNLHDGNELADREAKRATVDGCPLMAPYPRSIIKKIFREHRLKLWNRQWTEIQNRTKIFIPSIKEHIFTINKYLMQFISGHGPFLDYLFRFKIKNNQYCPCNGRLGDPDHYVFDCEFTKDYHLNGIQSSLKYLWLENILNNKEDIEKIRICIQIASNQVNEN